MLWYYLLSIVATITRTTRVPGVIGALVLASVLIGGAYTLANPRWLPFRSNVANAASAQALLQNYAKQDSDGDGLPDWEESLYGTDPKNPHSVSPTLTDSEAVNQGLVQARFSSQSASSTPSINPADLPGTVAADNTVTSQFAQSLFSNYLSQANGSTPSESDISTYVGSAMQDFVAKHASQDIYTTNQVKVSGSGADALTTYAAKAEQAFAANTIASDKSEVDYFSDAVEKNDTDALAHVAAIGKAYTAIATAFIQVPVPSEAQSTHLKIANALARIGQDITDMGALNTDPLRAYLGLSDYETDSHTLVSSFSDLNQVFMNDNVTITDGAGSSIYKTVQMAAKTQ